MGTVPLFHLSHRKTKRYSDLSLLAPSRCPLAPVVILQTARVILPTSRVILPTSRVILPSGRIWSALVVDQILPSAG